jgi:hypothetical protein
MKIELTKEELCTLIEVLESLENKLREGLK